MNRYSKIIRLLIVLSILSVGAMVLALGAGSREAAFVPPPFEPEAVAGTPEVPEGLGYRELDARVFRVGVCGEVVAQEDRAVLWFTNPMGNEVWLRLRILDESGSILGQTGLLRPGEYVRSVQLASVPAAGCAIVLKLMAYEPQTYHSAGAVTVSTTLRIE